MVSHSFEVFAQRGWLAEPTDTIRDQIIDMGKIQKLKGGEQVYMAGDAPGGIYGIISGSIGIEISTANLVPRLGHIYRAGIWFGQGPALDGRRRSLGFRAMEESRLLYVSLKPLQALIASNAEVARRLGALANDGMTVAVRAACELLIPQSLKRIAAVIIRVTAADEGVVADDPLGFAISQAELSEMSNTSRHTTLRALAELSQCGCIAKSYGHIRILDLQKLSEIAYSDI